MMQLSQGKAKHVAEIINDWRNRRRAIHQLRAMSDRQIHDLGHCRFDFERWIFDEARQRPVKCFTPFE